MHIHSVQKQVPSFLQLDQHLLMPNRSCCRGRMKPLWLCWKRILTLTHFLELMNHSAVVLGENVLLQLEEEGPMPCGASHHHDEGVVRQPRHQHTAMAVRCHANERRIVTLVATEVSVVDDDACEVVGWILQAVEEG